MKRTMAMGYSSAIRIEDRIIGTGVSILIHVCMCLVFVFFSDSFSGNVIPMRSIEVDISGIAPVKGPPAKRIAEKTETPVLPPASEKQKAVKPEPVKKAVQEKVPEPKIKENAISLKKDKELPPEKNTSANKKDEEDLIRKALQNIEKNVGKAPEKEVNPIADRLRSLAREAEQKHVGSGGDGGEAEGPSGTGADASLIEGYRLAVKIQVAGNWAFSQHLTGGVRNLETWVTFEVLPDGEIVNIEITRRSGNEYMDSAAVMAVKKSSPLRSWPQGISASTLKMGLKFKPDELR